MNSRRVWFAVLVSLALAIIAGAKVTAAEHETSAALKLFEAINKNDSAEVRQLLSQGVSLEYNYLMDQTPYRYAIKLGRQEIIKILFHEANLRRRSDEPSSSTKTPSQIPSSIDEVLTELTKMARDSESVGRSAAPLLDSPSAEQQSVAVGPDGPFQVTAGPATTLPDQLPLTTIIDGVDSEDVVSVVDPTDNKPATTPINQSEGIPSFTDWATVIFAPPPDNEDFQSAPQPDSTSTTDTPPSSEERTPQLALGDRVLGASEPTSLQNCKQRNDYKVCRITISWIKRLGRVVRTSEAIAVYSDGRARGYFVFFPVNVFANARDYLTARFGQPEGESDTKRRSALGLEEHQWWATDNNTNHILSLVESAGYKHINLRVDEAMLSLVEEGFEEIVSFLRMSDFQMALAD